MRCVVFWMLTIAAFLEAHAKKFPRRNSLKQTLNWSKTCQKQTEEQKGLTDFTNRIRIKACAVWEQIGLWGGGVLNPLSLRPRGTCYPLTVHPTGKLSLQPAITFDCICLYNLETLFIQPKTLPSSGRAGSIESMASDSFFFLSKAL